MKLTLNRKWFTDKSTIGELFINDVWEAFTLEDPVREGLKIPGMTAIPAGTYEVIINMSKRFKKEMPLLVGVPNFSGIRIHSGNKAEDTLGCILVGQSRDIDWIGRSKAAYQMLFEKIQFAIAGGEHITITIRDML
jgi:hypothetical protein